MPSLLEHVAIAGLVGLPLAKKPKWILALCGTAILPDFDLFLGLHRIAFHSLLVLLPISLSLIGLAWSRFPSYREPALFTAFCLLSHTALDALQYWVALLWPLVPLNFWLNVQLRLAIAGPVAIPYLAVGPMVAPLYALSEPGDAALLAPYDATLFLLFLSLALLRLWPSISPHLSSWLHTSRTRVS
jgi:membrane-bound metal-dependent hydrolase YbcI (DUF457 family)